MFRIPGAQPVLEAFFFFHSRNGWADLQFNCLRNQTGAWSPDIINNLRPLSSRKAVFAP